MRGTQTEERKLRTHANNVDKPEAAYCKALSDLRVFTCVQVQRACSLLGSMTVSERSTCPPERDMPS